MNFFNGLSNWFTNLTPILYYKQQSFELSNEVFGDAEQEIYNDLVEQNSVLQADGDTYFFELTMSFNRKEDVFFCEQHKQLYTRMLNDKQLANSDYDNLVKFESFRIYRNFINILGIRTVFLELDNVVKEGALAKLVFCGYLIRKPFFGLDTSNFSTISGFKVLSGLDMNSYLKLYENWRCGQIYFFSYGYPLDALNTEDDSKEQWYYLSDNFLRCLFFVHDVEYPIVLNRIILYVRNDDCIFNSNPQQCMFRYSNTSTGKHFCYSDSLICRESIDSAIYDYFREDTDFGHRLRLNVSLAGWSYSGRNNDISLFDLFFYAFGFKQLHTFFVSYRSYDLERDLTPDTYLGTCFYYQWVFQTKYLSYYRNILREIPRFSKTSFISKTMFYISCLLFILCTIFICYFAFFGVEIVYATEDPRIIYSVFKKEILDFYLHNKKVFPYHKTIYRSCHFQGLFDKSHYWFFNGNDGAVLTHRNLCLKLYSKNTNLLVTYADITGDTRPQYFGRFLKLYDSKGIYNLNHFFYTLVNLHPETQTLDDKHFIKFYKLETEQRHVKSYLKDYGHSLRSSFSYNLNKGLGETPYEILDKSIAKLKLPIPKGTSSFGV